MSGKGGSKGERVWRSWSLSFVSRIMSLIGSLFELIMLVTGLRPNPGHSVSSGGAIGLAVDVLWTQTGFLGVFEKQNPKPRKHESRAVRGFEYGGPSRTRTYDQGIMSCWANAYA